MSKIDSITVEVMRNYLLSAAREMNRNLMRTSYNTIVYEVRDFGLGIYDSQCRLLAEAPGLALFTRANDYALKKIVEFLGEENIHPGDVILLNYPFWSSTHTLDVTASSPIFFDDQLVGFTAVKMHWLDLDQKDPGYCLDTVDMHQEGLFLPCSKIYKQGVLNKELADIIAVRTRSPRLQPWHDPVANLVYATRGSDVTAVFVEGRQLVRLGRPVFLDTERILAHAAPAAGRLADVRG